MFVASSICGLQQGKPGEQRFAGGIPAFQRVAYHLHRLAGRRHHLNGELVEKALHPQQWRDMGFIVDAARHVEEIAEPLADHVVCGMAGPFQHRLVHERDTTVCLDREVAARRVLEHILKVVDAGFAHDSTQTNVRMAAMTSSGALRLGQWPVASKMTISLPAMPR